MKLRSDLVPPKLKRVIHTGSRAYGRLTSSGRLLPGFLLCGGQRCGTTSLYRALSTHPAVLKPVFHKGVHYFDTGYHRGVSWYRAHFPTRGAALRVSEQTGLAVQAFESSPYYLYHPLAAERFARDLPGVKLIVLTRDPVQRARSQHAHEVARGFEPIADFAEALDSEKSRLDGECEKLRRDSRYYSFSHQHHGYLDRGRYADHLDRIAQIVAPERILVLDSGDYFKDPEAVFHRALRFLGLPWQGEPRFGRHNARPRTEPDDLELDAELREHFAPYDMRLAEWLGATPSWRR